LGREEKGAEVGGARKNRRKGGRSRADQARQWVTTGAARVNPTGAEGR